MKGALRRVLIVAVGGIVGLGCAMLLLSTELPQPYQRRLGDLLMVAAHPIAVALSAVTGWPLQQESGIVIHIFSVFTLFVVAGMIAAGLATRRRT